jgi:hypothetical protein
MQIAPGTVSSIIPIPPPPLWYVTNGEITVGPVVTNLLVRGIEAGRVPDFCEVRATQGHWRRLNGVREVAALSVKPNASSKPTTEQLAEWARPTERMRDETELAHTLTWLSLLVTGAENAMFHFRGRFGRSLVTRSVLGPMSTERLGYPLSEHDLLVRAARSGRPVFGPPFGPVEDALAMRFANSQGGSGAVAMIPFFIGKELTAMLELSRPGHAFRRSDLQRAEFLVKKTLLQRLG